MLNRFEGAALSRMCGHARSKNRTLVAAGRKPVTRRSTLLARCPAVVDALERRVLLSAVVQSAVSNSGSITPALDAYRVDLGGGAVAGANGSFGGLRREINWDGVPAPFAAPNSLPAAFFNVNSPRGVVFSTPGTGFEVSGATTDAGPGQPAAPEFGDINPTYSTAFNTFSPERLFT